MKFSCPLYCAESNHCEEGDAPFLLQFGLIIFVRCTGLEYVSHRFFTIAYLDLLSSNLNAIALYPVIESRIMDPVIKLEKLRETHIDEEFRLSSSLNQPVHFALVFECGNSSTHLK